MVPVLFAHIIRSSIALARSDRRNHQSLRCPSPNAASGEGHVRQLGAAAATRKGALAAAAMRVSETVFLMPLAFSVGSDSRRRQESSARDSAFCDGALAIQDQLRRARFRKDDLPYRD
jgi:hypothetical protein